ncbi:hypothetical protein AB0I00_06850 [Streptomyces sp. NPDC050803]|uniref:hypothetical protein n=1 Tax=unclassified Streptomyces TaxID=2593676 RepID=UPI00341CDC62
MSARRERWWRLAAAVLSAAGVAPVVVTAFVHTLPLPAVAVGAGCLLLSCFLWALSAPPLPDTVGPDAGDAEEWMGERFLWEPGDLDDNGEGARR